MMIPMGSHSKLQHKANLTRTASTWMDNSLQIWTLNLVYRTNMMTQLVLIFQKIGPTTPKIRAMQN